MNRELIAEQESERGGDQAKYDRVEQEHRDHGPGGIAVAAQIDDQPAALGHREKHRVEGEEEPDERADHREQGGRLVGCRRGFREQLFVLIGGLHVQPPAGEPLQGCPHLGFPARGWLDENAVQATLQARQFLRVFQRCERDRAVDQRPDLLFV